MTEQEGIFGLPTGFAPWEAPLLLLFPVLQLPFPVLGREPRRRGRGFRSWAWGPGDRKGALEMPDLGQACRVKVRPTGGLEAAAQGHG